MKRENLMFDKLDGNFELGGRNSMGPDDTDVSGVSGKVKNHNFEGRN